MIVATFWHADAARAGRCVAREVAARPEVNRVLQWNLGRMGVVTRFYTVVSYIPMHLRPHQTLRTVVSDRDYFDDWFNTNAAQVFAR